MGFILYSVEAASAYSETGDDISRFAFILSEIKVHCNSNRIVYVTHIICSRTIPWLTRAVLNLEMLRELDKY